MAVARVSAQGQRTLVAVDGSPVVSPDVVQEAEAVQGGRLALLVTEFALQLEGALAVLECLFLAAEAGLAPSRAVERERLADRVAGAPEQVDGEQRVCESLAVWYANGGNPDNTMPVGTYGSFTTTGWNDAASSIGYDGCP